MGLQQQSETGRWEEIDPEWEEKFLSWVLEREPWFAPRVKREPMTTPEQVREYLATGQTIHYDSDWYAVIRDGDAAQAATERRRQQQVEPALCDCGHYSNHPMSSGRGTACPDCYDRMSE